MAEVARRVDQLDDAKRLFENVLSIANDVGLLAEEYDPVLRRMVGNFPQAFSHVARTESHCLAGLGTISPASSVL